MNENSNELHELTRKLVKIRVNSLLFTQETEKVDGRLYEVPLVQGSACQQKSDEQESSYCHECHTYERTVRP